MLTDSFLVEFTLVTSFYEFLLIDFQDGHKTALTESTRRKVDRPPLHFRRKRLVLPMVTITFVCECMIDRHCFLVMNEQVGRYF